MPNSLFYGDNLQVLRDHIPDESVDLVYLDPPFNSNASYNVLFREKSGEESPAQIRPSPIPGSGPWRRSAPSSRTSSSIPARRQPLLGLRPHRLPLLEQVSFGQRVLRV